MYIKRIEIHNFRILSDVALDLDREKERDQDKDPCLLIGRNNAGKTSFLVAVEKFLRNQSFEYNDFPVSLRESILGMDENTDETKLAIRMVLTISYGDGDNLSSLSRFIVDLKPDRQEVYLLFECGINKAKLLADAKQSQTDKAAFIRRHLTDYLKNRVYTFADRADMDGKREELVEKAHAEVEDLIDFEIIHARRNVASSEERNGRKVLSRLTTDYFNAESSRGDSAFRAINELIEKTDQDLDDTYNDFFGEFLDNARRFLGIDTLRVRSNLSAREILEDASAVVYGAYDTQLPENQSGLGHVNILYLLLSLEMKKRGFAANNKDIRLLFIEEPEAHTHPQLQYNFAREIKNMLGDDEKLQTVITTHSSHIVSRYPFENLRYMAAVKEPGGSENVVIKHFERDLRAKYQNEPEQFHFVKQYLTIVSSELFFADKAIFIEGTSEALMLPYFISRFDRAHPGDIPLAAQNITIIEAGANAKAFRHFVEFLGIPTLVITDLDAVKRVKGTKTTTDESGNQTTKTTTNYKECKVSDPEACSTSNATIKYYLSAPDIKTDEQAHRTWFRDLCDLKIPRVAGNVRIAYQFEAEDFQNRKFRPRSFEDAFFHVNLQQVSSVLDKMEGMKNKTTFAGYVNKGPAAYQTIKDTYDLTEKVLSGKSDLASSLLYLAYTGKVEWNTPKYIEEGLEWLKDQTH